MGKHPPTNIVTPDKHRHGDNLHSALTDTDNDDDEESTQSETESLPNVITIKGMIFIKANIDKLVHLKTHLQTWTQ